VADRSEFSRLERSRPLARVDDRDVWSVVCFYIHRKHRRSGVGSALLRAAVDHAVSNGARIVEGYPVDPKGEKVSSASIFTGNPAMFEAAGFREVERRNEKRPIMRWEKPRRSRR
ncbi:MAG TPA: GNAT family N-acetyltransferase, partial [Actinomycetota bacterium]|nr:GNAT family N-acetyltransferase [Actinomycetota bacterium]